jgi:ABC-type Zn uptake system ZnuABC Zn-binding protein ZnuA/ABC-type Mn2+/Zn2+ transport system permease subunit
MDFLFGPLSAPYFQRAAVVVVLLGVAGGLLGAWIALRGLAFYAHASGSATFPGLVVAGPWGLPPLLAALGSTLLFGALLQRTARRAPEQRDAATGILLVGALALGAVLASDVYRSGRGVDTLLFGTLLGLTPGDEVVAALAAGAAAVATLALHRTWLAAGFDAPAAAAAGLRVGLADTALLLLVAAAIVAALPAVGALLAGALFVVPAATARLVAPSIGRLLGLSVMLAVAEGLAGLWLADRLNVPPGPAVALLAGGAFALVATARALGGRRALALAGTGAVLLLAGCGGGSDQANPQAKLRIVVTTSQVGDLVRQVAGPRVQVTQLIPTNADPHDYEPRPQDAKALADADLVFRSGGEIDAWLSDLVDQAGSDAIVVDLSRAVVLREQNGQVDPHWWHDPRNWKAAIDKVQDKLIQADSDGALPYKRRGDAYKAKVTNLERRLARCLGSIPAARRVLVTDHDALGYWAARYRFRIVGAIIPSLSAAGQPSAGQTAKLVATIRRERVSAIFVETSLSSRLAQNLARAGGVKLVTQLYADTLATSGRAATWLGSEQVNAERIAGGLTDGRVTCAAGAA